MKADDFADYDPEKVKQMSYDVNKSQERWCEAHGADSCDIGFYC